MNFPIYFILVFAALHHAFIYLTSRKALRHKVDVKYNTNGFFFLILVLFVLYVQFLLFKKKSFHIS